MSAGDDLFPVGFHELHRNRLFNFTLNRWHSIGFARLDDMVEAGRNIKAYDDWTPEMIRLANLAANEDRLVNAAIYFRSAEFFAAHQDSEREALYDRFRETFDTAFAADVFERLRIPFGESWLPAVRISPEGANKGTILLHGGMDSFLEEWYLMMRYLAAAGYQVIGFEGPGQGEALIKAKLAFDHRWERPTSAILDYFDLEDVSLVGLSVGGWLCMRAAAFEPRIQRVIASGHAIDYMEMIPGAIRWMFPFFMRYKSFFNKASLWKMKRNPRMRWEIGQVMHMARAKTPVDAAKRVSLALSRTNMQADRIRQDVLFFSGEKDHFIPIRMHKRQVEALANARSVTDRVFTKEEQAHNHCQIGNIGLALDAIVGWLEVVT